MNPKLSIITVNLNNKDGLQKTINSVINQTFTNYEFIIIDGGSTDGSKEIIKKSADHLTYWVSEPDKGIFAGMNKGIKVANGEYCLFLNSGDCLLSNEILKSVFDLNLTEDIIFGNLKVNDLYYIYPDVLNLSYLVNNHLPHPASFIKTSLFERFGFYENYRIISDWVFFIKCIIVQKCSYKHINKTISLFEVGGISSNSEFSNETRTDKLKFLQTIFPNVPLDVFISLLDLNKSVKILKRKLCCYENSRIIKFIKKIQNSRLYYLIKLKE